VKSRVQREPQAHRLCSLCSERQKADSLGFEVVPGSECALCGGVMDRTAAMAELASRRARPYVFRTFTVGVSLPEGVQEREDELRSDLKLKGNETVKTQAARLVASQVARLTRKRLDKRNPDVMMLANFAAGEVSISSKPVFYYGRYAKPSGISQRRTFCEQCRGSGCEKCRGTGYAQKPSVEDALRRKLSGFSGSAKMVFTWLGSEDRESRVLPPGRPFVVEIKNPRKRKLPSKFGARIRGKTVSVRGGRVLPSKPTHLPSFRFLTEIKATTKEKVGAEALRGLKSAFRKTTVTFQRPNNRPATKMVYSASATAAGRTLRIRAELDGGLPVKRFVSGELVSPSVSEVLKTEVGCRSFDICGVREIGGFGFAEIARDEEKD
jgi:tRNA pseudouridine synthase 10